MLQKPKKTKRSGRRPQTGTGQSWLLFFYSVPAKPVNNRVRIWRRLAKAGAAQVKGSVYLLPYSDDHAEFLQWLSAEVSTMGGEALFVKTDRIEPLQDDDLKRLFLVQKAKEYEDVAKALDDLERRLSSIRKGSAARKPELLSARLDRIEKEFAETKKTDFFGAAAAADLARKIGHLRAGAVSLPSRAAAAAAVPAAEAARYRGRTWVTRRRPFVDRMASAWLIRSFIDPQAVFSFVAEGEMPADREAVVFDMAGGDFTHTADLCTFEVLVRAFGIKDRAVRRIAEIVHELDIRDDKYRTPEAAGVEEILSGIRKAEKDDLATLEQGIAVFEMLYRSRAG